MTECRKMHCYAALLLLLLPCTLTLAAKDLANVSYRIVPPPNDRFHEQTERNVRVTTAVPSAQETQAIFGIKLYRNKIVTIFDRHN